MQEVSLQRCGPQERRGIHRGPCNVRGNDRAEASSLKQRQWPWCLPTAGPAGQALSSRSVVQRTEGMATRVTS